MKAYFVSLTAVLLCAGTLSAQSMVEHAAALAGATAGVGGGKLLSNGIDKLLGKAAETGDTAATTKPKKTPAPTGTPTTPAVVTSGGGPAAPDLPNSAPYARSTSRRGAGRNGTAERSYRGGYEEPAASVAWEPSPEDIARVNVGDSSEKLASLGVPASHVTIPEEGRFVEILSYWAGGRRTGAVRLDGGVVVSVYAAR